MAIGGNFTIPSLRGNCLNKRKNLFYRVFNIQTDKEKIKKRTDFLKNACLSKKKSYLCRLIYNRGRVPQKLFFMSVKLRLQRHGKKGKPFYWIVAANVRSPRDGKFLEKLGTYDPVANPAEITIDIDAAVRWLHNGAQPTLTVRNILSHQGVLLRHHLDGGIAKGALTKEQADAKFEKWKAEKEEKILAKKQALLKGKNDAKAKALEAEKAYNQKRKEDAQAKLEEANSQKEEATEQQTEAQA